MKAKNTHSTNIRSRASLIIISKVGKKFSVLTGKYIKDDGEIHDLLLNYIHVISSIHYLL